MSPITLSRADIVFVRGKSRFARLVRFFTRDPGEERSLISHVAVAVDDLSIVEALGSGVVRRRLKAAYPDGVFAIYRPTKLRFGERAAIAAAAERFVGDRYGWTKIAAHFLDYLLGGAQLFRRLCAIDRTPICSYLVARSYSAVGERFGVAPGAAAPDDIWDHVTSHPADFAEVFLSPTARARHAARQERDAPPER